MGYKTLLAILQGEDDAKRVLGLAVPLAAHGRSHLIGLHATALPMVYAAPMGAPMAGLNEASRAFSEERVAALRKLFDERTRAEGVSAEWRGMENVSGDAALSGLESAHCADLVIVQQIDPDASSDQIANVEALIFETGRPVLFVPYAGRTNGPVFKRILVAWNGTRESARATFDALPFLKQAEAVEVLTVDAADSYKQDAPVAGAEICAALARHDVQVTLKSETSGELPAGEVIENRVSDFGAELLVMGAYGHSRLRQFVFGGVTRTVLGSMPVPTLMAR
ncbi:universal stress protein [Aquibium sp. A9E412]|uniref:universal stress protein n=1 Tax=Aquibium sp. A9E412 TaxID=2976767 RepID=UPI0025B24716|nr:universal stress protein [Aquibium sp. A9E412]MDN2565975.1 universal stress protein [Aquibium sp. A9E412]